MFPRNVMRVLGPVAMAVCVAGCEDPAGVSGNATFAITVDQMVLAVGGHQAVPMEGADQGRTLGPGDVTWTSSDTTTAVVDDGTVVAKAPGVVWVYGQAGRARDSVRVQARVTDLAEGEAVTRVQRAQGGEPYRFHARAGVMESLVGGFPTMTGIGLSADSLGLPSGAAPAGSAGPNAVAPPLADVVVAQLVSALTVRLPGKPKLGTTYLGPTLFYHSQPFFGSDGGVQVDRLTDKSPSEEYEVWVGVDHPELDIDGLIEGTPLQPGRLQGSLSFEAAGFLTQSPEWSLTPLSDTTVRVYAQFDIPIYYSVTGGGTLTTAGPFGSGTTTTTAQGTMVADEGLRASMNAVMPPTEDETSSSISLHLEVWLPTPSVGDVSLPPSGGEIVSAQPGGATPWMRAILARPVQSPDSLEAALTRAVSRSGVFTIAEYTPPSSTTMGLLKGHFQVEMEVWDGTALTGTTFTLSGDVTLPFYPPSS